MPRSSNKHRKPKRRGAVAVLCAVLLVPLMGMMALAVDYGYLCVVRTELQRAADAAALAAVRDLVPDSTGYQDLGKVRATAKQYAAANIKDVANFTVLDSDIEIGRYDPATIYTGVTLLNTGVFDTVRVKVRRDNQANSPVQAFFARIFGIQGSNVTATATAVLQKASFIPAGGDVLPFAVPEDVWDMQKNGDSWIIYDNMQMTDLYGDPIPGNWGTVDIGYTNNSTNDINDQVLNGLRQADLDWLYSEGRISSSEYFNANDQIWLSADTGLSQGVKNSVTQVYDQIKLIPIFDQTNAGSSGENLEYHVVKWGVVKVTNSTWGNPVSITIERQAVYNGLMKAQKSLANTGGVIEGMYTIPALVE